MATGLLVLLLLLIQSVIIASQNVINLSMIEGMPVEIPPPAEVNGKSENKITVNWVRDRKPNVRKLITFNLNKRGRIFMDDNTESSQYGDLIIQPVERQDAGYYTCQAFEHDTFNIWTVTYHLDVYYMDAPTVLGPFYPKNHGDNFPVHFFCTWNRIHPEEEPMLTWLLDGNELNTTTIKYEETQSAIGTLVIYNVSASEVGTYTCLINVTTNLGMMSKRSNSKELFEVTHKRKPVIKGIPIVNVKEGAKEIMLMCEHPAVNKTISATLWNEVDEEGKIIELAIVDSIRKTNGKYKMVAETGKSNLNIEYPTRNYSGKRFVCIVIFDDETTVFSDPSTLLNVWYLDEPVITMSMKNSIYIGDSVILNCRVESNPSSPLRVTWIKNNATIITNDFSRFDDELNILRIQAVSLEDNGNYQCAVENDVYEKEKMSAHFEILVIDFFIDTTFILDPETWIVTCIADGHPTPSFVAIFYNGEKVADGISSTSFQIANSTWKNASIVCFTRNEILNKTTQLHKSNIDDEEHCSGLEKGSLNQQPLKPINTVIILTAAASLILGFFPTCLVACYINKKKERQIHSFYQKNYYQSLQFTCGPAAYKELNTSSNVTGSTTTISKNDNFKSKKDNVSSKVDVIYEDVKN